MGDSNSLSEFYLGLYCSLFGDLANRHTTIYDRSGFDRDYQTVVDRHRTEGMSFLTKTLPLLGKAVDNSLSSHTPLHIPGWQCQPGTVLPKFMGGLFEAVYTSDGNVRDDSPTEVVVSIRQVAYLLYKLRLPYSNEQEQKVVQAFTMADDDLENLPYNMEGPETSEALVVLELARQYIRWATCTFDPYAITPRHGPGVVATGEKAWEKMRFKRFYPGIDKVYSYSEYFFYNPTHLCDTLQDLESLEPGGLPTAKVVLVPKDSRGPRLISCEPLEYQWMQQGLSRALVKHIESNYWTAGHVNFTDQEPNRQLALAGSKNGRYVTLDMKEASDRVSLGLVKDLFEPRLFECLAALRTEATRLPNGEVKVLKKFAPMGSALCFPVEALVFYALCLASIRRTHGLSWRQARNRIWVYGDDIIALKEDYSSILRHLPMFGLLFNEGKCCTEGFFRESCGMDAFKGTNVTPLKMRSVWTSSGPENMQSQVSYSNWLYLHGYHGASEYLRDRLVSRFGDLPLTTSLDVDAIAFISYGGDLEAYNSKRFRTRFNRFLHRREWKVPRLRGSTKRVPLSGWSDLLLMHSRQSDDYSSPGAMPGSYAVPHRSYLQRGWSEIV